MKEYADPVIDWLDAGRGILPVRYFREVSHLSSVSQPLALIQGELVSTVRSCRMVHTQRT